ncbi:unnamed protein product [Rotaria socialis]|uniref:Uncharacterized protein n=1 Tax=Rotaria socialis TaxID=392032 RepID=A0A821RN85_9BILA|nr:unnamed protein product [Rotaria socialis]CAF4842550.1 unnamed protein product [Rotaria socialis]
MESNVNIKDQTSNSHKDYYKFLSQIFTSKKEFVSEYKKIYFGKAKAKELYHHILNELKRTVSEGNINSFKKFSTLIDDISHVENKETLRTFYHDDDENPIKSTNLVILACQNNKVKILEYLFSYSSNILYNLSAKVGKNSILLDDEDETGHNAFYYAILSGSTELIDALINSRIGNYFVAHLDELEVILSKVYEELTPTQKADCLNNIDITKVLLKYGAVSNNKSILEMTNNAEVINLLTLVEKLFKAVKSDRALEIEKCIDGGAVANAKNASGETPLHIAAWKGDETMVEILLMLKCNPNAVGKGGFTPLHYAAKFSHLEVVKVLLANGAKYNVSIHNGKTSIDFAKDKDIISLIQLVKESFQNVIDGNSKVIDNLNQVKDIDTIKAVMNARDCENKSLVVVAMLNNFSKVQQLKEIFQGDVATEVELALKFATHPDKFQVALKVLVQIGKRREEILGPDNPGMLDIQLHIGCVVFEQGYYEEALTIYEEILQPQEGNFGLNCKDALNTRNCIAFILHRLNRNEEALSIYKEVIERQREILQPNDLDALKALGHMAIVLNSLGKCEEALSIYQTAFKTMKEILGANSPTTLSTQDNMALILGGLRRYEEALNVHKEVYEKRKEVLGIHHSDTLRTLRNIADILDKQNKSQEAFTTFQEILNAQKNNLGPKHVDTIRTQHSMARLLFTQGNLLGALKAYKDGFEQRKSILGPSHSIILDSIQKIDNLYWLLKLQGCQSTDINLYLNNDLNKAALNGNLKMVKRLIKLGADVNEKDIDGRAPLHFATDNKHIDIVDLLMKNGADVTQVTCKGNTPLHTAASKGFNEIAEVLLKYVSREQLNDFVDAKTTLSGTTSLHVASKNGTLDMVKTLLQYGATYNIGNKQGKTPLDLSKDNKTIKFLKLVEELFEDSRKGNVQMLDKLQAMESDELLAVINARNDKGKTLIQVAVANQHKDLAGKIIRTPKLNLQSC